MQEMSCHEILTGKGEYRGLVPIIMAYLDQINTDEETTRVISSYMDFIVARASGDLVSPATWMRDFITSHPDYKQDSRVSQKIGADLCAACHKIGTGALRIPEMHGDFEIKSVDWRNAYAAPLVSTEQATHDETGINQMVDRYVARQELAAKRRKLSVEVEAQKAALGRAQAELDALDRQMKASGGAVYANGASSPALGVDRSPAFTRPV